MGELVEYARIHDPRNNGKVDTTLDYLLQVCNADKALKDAVDPHLASFGHCLLPHAKVEHQPKVNCGDTCLVPGSGLHGGPPPIDSAVFCSLQYAQKVLNRTRVRCSGMSLPFGPFC